MEFKISDFRDAGKVIRHCTLRTRMQVGTADDSRDCPTQQLDIRCILIHDHDIRVISSVSIDSFSIYKRQVTLVVHLFTVWSIIPIMSPIRPVSFLDLILLLVFSWLLLRVARSLRRRAKATLLKGPASNSWIFGVSQFLGAVQNPAVVHEEWAEKYGPVFRIPLAMGANRIYILDPKAIAYITSRDTSRYVHNALSRVFIENMVGRLRLEFMTLKILIIF